MKILMVNKFHYIKGGSETYYFALKRMLEQEGHTVIDFSMTDEKNFESPYARYFVDNVDYSSSGGFLKKMKMAKNIIYSSEAKKKFAQLVEDEKPDLVHLHIFQHQISPSILDIIKKHHIPTVYTAHDLKMVCLNYKMMHHGHICEECRGGHYMRCAKNKCVKESFSKSLINVAEGYLHKLRKSYDAIDVIVTPSDFYRRKFIEFGVDEERIVHIPNFLDREDPLINPLPDCKKYYLYFGRLSEEKGVSTLMKAAGAAGVKLKVVGTGPLYDQLSEQAGSEYPELIEMMGFRSGQELTDIVGNSKAVILPSEWYENGPYSAIESLQVGRPIIGADIGGIPELIDGNGYLFPSGNAAELEKVLKKMEGLSAEEYSEMERNSRKLYEDSYTWGSHYEKLSKVYDTAIQKKT